MKTVILLSGGIDSTVLAYHWKDQGNELHGLSVDYGQSHQRELLSAAFVASQVCESYECIDVPPIFAPNALTGEGGSVVVPARNLVLLTLASVYATSIDADDVLIGIVKEDAERFPDCHPEFVCRFIECFGLALGDESTNQPITRAPFIDKTKAEVVRLGNDLGVHWSKTWSCYGGGVEPCGECLACEERAKVFDV